MSAGVTITRLLSPTSPTQGSNLSAYSNAVGNTFVQIGPIVFPANSNANNSFTISFNATALQEIYLVSDKGMTLNFNNAANNAADPQVVLKPGSAFEWNSSDGYFPNPFNSNVVNCFVFTTASSRLQGVYLTP